MTERIKPSFEELEKKPLPFVAKVISSDGKIMSEGGRDVYWKYHNKISQMLDLAFPEGPVGEWLDLAAIPATLEGGVALIALDESEKVCGFIHGRPESCINGPEGTEKWVTSVVAAYPPGKGMGGKMLETFKTEAVKAGAKVLFIRTDPSRLDTIKFYTGHGGEMAGRLEYYYSYPTEQIGIGKGRSPTVWFFWNLEHSK